MTAAIAWPMYSITPLGSYLLSCRGGEHGVALLLPEAADRAFDPGVAAGERVDHAFHRRAMS